MTERESKVQKKMMNIIKEHSGYVHKNAQNMYTEKGRPDLTACVPASIKNLLKIFGEDAIVGLFVGIEVKRDKKVYDASDAQEIVGRKIKNAKGIWLSVDDPDIVEALMIKLTKEV